MFRVLPQTLDPSLFFVLPQRLFVSLLPQSLLLPMYCHKHLTMYCFSCAATKTLCWCTAIKPITFHILPQTLDSLLLFMCCEYCWLYYSHRCCYFTTATILDSSYCNKCRLSCLLPTSVSTCFRHHYAHLQENKDRALLHTVYCAGSARCGW